MGVPIAKGEKLDRAEASIEESIDRFVPISGEKRRRIDTILEATRKTRKINIRISELDLPARG